MPRPSLQGRCTGEASGCELGTDSQAFRGEAGTASGKKMVEVCSSKAPFHLSHL